MEPPRTSNPRRQAKYDELVNPDTYSPDLCGFCLDAVRWLISNKVEVCEWRRGKSWAKDFKRTATLEESAKYCKLCAITFEEPISDQEDVECDWTVIAEATGFHQDGDLVVGFSTGGIDFAVWTDEGNAAEGRVTNWSPFTEPSLQHTCEKIRRYQEDCALGHQLCLKREDGCLPDRVICITENQEKISIKLMETKGQIEKYCALSHCWGPPGKMSVRTLKTNLTSYLEDIPITELPRTFREAIEIVNGVGIKYLWIDSLCIVQDDNQDWHSQSLKMDQVYRGASLVLYAAGSSDPSQGLLIMEAVPSPQFTLELPYILGGSVCGSFYISRAPSDFDVGFQLDLPTHGPLYERAWALQEAYLARRLVTFMPRSMEWKCPGSRYNLGFHEEGSWFALLEKFGKKKLTYPKDRIPAISGIATEMQKSGIFSKLLARSQNPHNAGATPAVDHTFDFASGLWNHDLPKQLLWRFSEHLKGGQRLDLPSWSWATAEGRKLWLFGRFETKPCIPQTLDMSGIMLDDTPTEISSLGSKSLGITGKMRSCKFYYHVGFRNKSDMHSFEESFMMPHAYVTERSHCPSFVILGETPDRSISGIAVFDENVAVDATAIFMGRTERRRNYDEFSGNLQILYREMALFADNECSGTEESCGFARGAWRPYIGEPQIVNDSCLPTPVRLHTTDWDPRTSVNISEPETRKSLGTSAKRKWSNASVQNSTLASEQEPIKLRRMDERTSPDESPVTSIFEPDYQSIVKKLLDLQRTTNHIYWALLVTPTNGGKYKRTGMAMFYEHAYNADDTVTGNIEMV